MPKTWSSTINLLQSQPSILIRLVNPPHFDPHNPIPIPVDSSPRAIIAPKRPDAVFFIALLPLKRHILRKHLIRKEIILSFPGDGRIPPPVVIDFLLGVEKSASSASMAEITEEGERREGEDGSEGEGSENCRVCGG
mmetsp:Transcript_23582/g.48119  ORF Transcript_23582/g.48119 Transcript_23582/m.48119 type:complete len:137 (+) Transcript_23582:243-653(+)